MKITTAVKRERSKLIAKVKDNGLWENFGQKEVRKLKDKYIDISKYTDEMNRRRDIIQDFNEWCMSCDDSIIK